VNNVRVQGRNACHSVSTEGKIVSIHRGHVTGQLIRIATGTVLLHLFAGALARRLPPSEQAAPITGIYIPTPSPFPALESFIEDTVKNYNIELFRCQNPAESALGGTTTPPQLNAGSKVANSLSKTSAKANAAEGMRQALEMYKKRYPDISAILVGTRQTDPHGGIDVPLTVFR
jgi:FAD synthetase